MYVLRSPSIFTPLRSAKSDLRTTYSVLRGCEVWIWDVTVNECSMWLGWGWTNGRTNGIWGMRELGSGEEIHAVCVYICTVQYNMHVGIYTPYVRSRRLVECLAIMWD